MTGGWNEVVKKLRGLSNQSQNPHWIHRSRALYQIHLLCALIISNAI